MLRLELDGDADGAVGHGPERKGRRGHPRRPRSAIQSGGVTSRPFEVICEVEPATQPDLMRVRHQIGVLSTIASAFLIPDNHIGRATVSSIAVAHEVARMGGRAIACLNARDRNVLGFRRDLLTAAAYGVDEFLFVYGDRPESGSRSDDLTVRSMIAEARDVPCRSRIRQRPVHDRRHVDAPPAAGVEARRRPAVRPGLVLARPTARSGGRRSTSPARCTPA